MPDNGPLTQVETSLLNQIQSDFPLDAQPFEKLAVKLGISESAVIDLIGRLKKRGVIRRIGAVFDSQKLGLKSTLCAMKAPVQRMNEIAELVNSYPEVTHNYAREHEFNLWVTLIAGDEKRMTEIIEEIKKKAGIKEYQLLFSAKEYKKSSMSYFSESGF